MCALSITLLGQFSITCGSKALEDLMPSKAKELLCYLLTHRQQATLRESLASILWGDCTTAHSKKYLRKALWQLQRSLGAAASGEGFHILEADAERIFLRPDAEINLDVAEFERCFASSQNATGGLDECCVEAFQEGVDLYRGDFLEGWYQDWCLCERERLQNMYLVMLGKLLAFCVTCRKYEKGMDYAARLLHYDRAHETAYQHLMRLHYLAGDRAGALRQYERCADALKEELGVEPSARTQELCRQIREDRISALTTPHSEAHEAGESLSRLRGALSRLRELKNTLASLQTMVEQTLLSVEKVLEASPSGPNPVDKRHS
jgi:DNA-binding SARP family transcriptional activator